MSFLKGFVDSIKYHQAMEEREKERQMQLEERQTQRQFTLDRDEANRAFQREMYETRRKDVLQERGYKIRSEMDAIEADANKYAPAINAVTAMLSNSEGTFSTPELKEYAELLQSNGRAAAEVHRLASIANSRRDTPMTPEELMAAFVVTMEGEVFDESDLFDEERIREALSDLNAGVADQEDIAILEQQRDLLSKRSGGRPFAVTQMAAPGQELLSHESLKDQVAVWEQEMIALAETSLAGDNLSNRDSSFIRQAIDKKDYTKLYEKFGQAALDRLAEFPEFSTIKDNKDILDRIPKTEEDLEVKEETSEEQSTQEPSESLGKPDKEGRLPESSDLDDKKREAYTMLSGMVEEGSLPKTFEEFATWPVFTGEDEAIEFVRKNPVYNGRVVYILGGMVVPLEEIHLSKNELANSSRGSSGTSNRETITDGSSRRKRETNSIRDYYISNRSTGSSGRK